MINFPRRFGVHSNLKQGIKIWGPIYAMDALILVITLMAMAMGSDAFFSNCASHIPKIIYNICMGLLGVYTILRPRSNPGKRNINMLILTFTPSIRFFQSIFTHKYTQMNELISFDTPFNHRLPVTKQDIKGDKYE